MPKSSRQKSLKPLFDVGTAVYSAYWGPEDTSRSEPNPAWYPGVVSSYRVGPPAADDRYGHVRYYHVDFDDGDKIDDVADCFVMATKEYSLRYDSDHEPRSWLGVKNVTDRKSDDGWARHVGWYVATLNGENHTFSLLSDALRAYDASVVRAGGGRGPLSELNLPGDWGWLFEGRKKSTDEAAIEEGAKDGIDEAQRRHMAELEQLRNRLRKKYDFAKDVAVKEAASIERRRVREMQHQLKEQLNAQHEEGITQLIKQFQEEKKQLADELAAKARKTTKRKNCSKPLLKVGEEVYAAWWPNISEQNNALWFTGHVKSYRELESNNENGENGEDIDYGPTRLYKIKYDDDGDELDNVPEHLVFPKADYLLYSQHDPSHKWKGVQNVVDNKSSDEYAKLVGWYIAMIDGQEVSFPRLSDALRAYDVSVVQRKGDKTKRNELNLPGDWEWLFSKIGIQMPDSHDGERQDLYNDEQLRKQLEKEKEKLKRKLNKKHSQEMESAVRKALEDENCLKLQMQFKLRDDLKEYYEKEMARAVAEAREEAHCAVEDAARTARHEQNMCMEKLKGDVQQQFSLERLKAMENARGAARTARHEHNILMDKLKGDLQQQFSHEKLNAMEKLGEELQQGFHREKEKALAELRADLEQRFHHEKKRALHKQRVETQQPPLTFAQLMYDLEQPTEQEQITGDKNTCFELIPPPPAKRAKFCHGHGGIQAQASSMTPSKPSGIVGRDNLTQGRSQLISPPLSTGGTAPSKPQFKPKSKDQAAGEHTTECNNIDQRVAAVLLEVTREHKTEDQHGHHKAVLAIRQKERFAKHNILIAVTVSQLVKNLKLDVSNMTNDQLADALKAGGFKRNDWYDEELQEVVRDRAKKGKILTALIVKTALSLAPNACKIESDSVALSKAMQDNGFPQESVHNQQLRENILKIVNDCFIARGLSGGKP